MKRYLILLCVALISCSAYAQGVTQAEYFWNADPGPGNGTPVAAVDGSFGQAIEALIASNVTILSVGQHVFHIRVRDNNTWGPVFKTVVNIESALSTARPIRVSAAEYFWGNDPGAGNGSPMLAFDGNYNDAVETILQQGIGVPAQGVHLFNMRVRDAENVWGPLFRTVVNVEAALSTARPIRVSAGEYFFDNDPGAGNGTPMLSTTGNFNNAIQALIGGNIPSPVTQGVHVLWMRARGADNLWGPAFGVVVNMDTSIVNITAQINGPLSLCQGQSLSGLIYSAQAIQGSTYQWSVTNGAIVSGQGTSTVTVNWNPSGNRTLNLTQCLNNECDEASITFIVLPSFNTNASASICEGSSIFLGGALQTTAGVYTDVFTALNGCDSTIVTTLSVQSSITTQNNVSICAGQSYFAGGANQTTSGTYSDTFTSSGGCDSVVVTNLTVQQQISTTQTVEICQGGSAFLGGANQTVPGNYTDVFPSAGGCDSIVVSTLVVLPAPIENASVSVCAGQSFFVGGANQTTPGDYTDIVTDANGCETVLITTLTVLPPEVITASAQICQGGSIFLGGALQTQAGVYTDLSTDNNGCNVIIETTLSVVTVIQTNQNIQICEGDSVFAGGTFQSTEGQYFDTFISSGGCDSVVTTNLSIAELIVFNTNAQICDGDSILLEGGFQTEPGTYSDRFLSAAGCDSLVVTKLVVFATVLPIINLAGGLLTTAQYQSYQWYFNGNPIEGATNQFYQPEENGMYAVMVTAVNGCLGISNEFAYNSTNIGFGNANSKIEIYPNPSRGIFQIVIASGRNMQFKIYDLAGRIIQCGIERNGSGAIIDMAGMAKGIYVLEAYDGNILHRERLILQ